MYNLQDVADRIRKTAKENHIRLADLLVSCGLSKNYVNQLPNNKDIKPGNIYLIARRLDVSLDYLLTGKEKSTTPGGAVLELTPRQQDVATLVQHLNDDQAAAIARLIRQILNK